MGERARIRSLVNRPYPCGAQRLRRNDAEYASNSAQHGLFLSPTGPVSHRLLLRPRESRDLRLLASEIRITPTATGINWSEDVFGDAIAVASFEGTTDALTVESEVALDLGGKPWPVFPVAASAMSYPFLYADGEWTDLGALPCSSMTIQAGGWTPGRMG